jgi:hypothetical protein
MGIQRNEIKFPRKATEHRQDSIDRPPGGLATIEMITALPLYGMSRKTCEMCD